MADMVSEAVNMTQSAKANSGELSAAFMVCRQGQAIMRHWPTASNLNRTCFTVKSSATHGLHLTYRIATCSQRACCANPADNRFPGTQFHVLQRSVPEFEPSTLRHPGKMPWMRYFTSPMKCYKSSTPAFPGMPPFPCLP
jgi:hypothetical protein